MLVIYIDSFSSYIWHRRNEKLTAKKDEVKEAFANLDILLCAPTVYRETADPGENPKRPGEREQSPLR